MSVASEYNFKYSAIAYGSIASTVAYGGYYGADTGTAEVLGNAVAGSDITLELEYLTEFVGGVQTTLVNLLQNVVVYDGGVSDFEPYPTWYTITSGVTGVVTFNAVDAASLFYVYVTAATDLSNITFSLKGQTQAYNIYFICTSDITISGANYGNFIANNVSGVGTVNGSVSALGGSISGLTVRLGSPRYTFTYAAISNKYLYNLNVFGGKYGRDLNNSGISVDVYPTNSTEDNDNAVSEITSLKTFSGQVVQFLNALDSSGAPIYTPTTITGASTVYPISTNNWYNLIITNTITANLTFIASNPDDVFYLVYTGQNEIRLDNVSFELNRYARIDNIYIISYSFIYLSRFPLYGHFINKQSFYHAGSESNYTVYGSLAVTTLSEGYLWANQSSDPFDNTQLTIKFITDTPRYVFTYAVIGYLGQLLVINGGKYGFVNGYDPDNVILNAIDGTDGAVDELSNIVTFKNEVVTFLTSTLLTNTLINGTLTLTPISNTTWYTFNIPDPTVTPSTTIHTITFDANGEPDAVFYIYNTANIYLYNVVFELTGNAQSSNIYIICDGNAHLYPKSIFSGNFIVKGVITNDTTSDDISTIYGTVSSINGDGAIAYNTITDENGYYDYQTLTVNFLSECFMEGTKILTDQWYVPVEELKVGNMVMTYGKIHDNKQYDADAPIPHPIVSIRKQVRTASRSASPIVFCKHTFASNKPFENLYVSPNHGMVDRKGRLYPAKRFINDSTIYQDPTIETISYYHLELATHCAIMANGVLTETWRDATKKILDINHDNV